jgi:hypothetical protein
MEITGKGWLIIAPSSPFYELAKKENLPCCTLCAAWVLDMAHDVHGLTVNDYARYDKTWWKAANVYDRDKPWSALAAAKEKLGGSVEYREKVNGDAPPLTAGSWHIIQRWGRLDLNESGLEDDQVVGNSYGHTYLAYAPAGAGDVTIVQSSIKKGYRVNTGAWEGGAGLDGLSVGVLTLPCYTEDVEGK